MCIHRVNITRAADSQMTIDHLLQTNQIAGDTLITNLWFKVFHFDFKIHLTVHHLIMVHIQLMHLTIHQLIMVHIEHMNTFLRTMYRLNKLKKL